MTPPLRYNRSIIVAAGKRFDELADRGVDTETVAHEFGIDPEALREVGFERALRAYAIASGQMQPRAGYQPTLVTPPQTEKQRALWAYLSAMWLDGFTCGVVAAKQTEPKEDLTGRERPPSFRDLEAIWEMGKQAIATWGDVAQERMIYEEAGELVVALAQHRRGRASKAEVLEECADAVIVAMECVALVGARMPEFLPLLRQKLIRLDQRLASHANHEGEEGAK